MVSCPYLLDLNPIEHNWAQAKVIQSIAAPLKKFSNVTPYKFKIN
ncbi:MAG: hypothetical protein RLY17_1286 [Pseudomonadota bacterium]|jgi:transposase